MNHLAVMSLVAVALLANPRSFSQSDWKPASGRLMTRWAKDVSPTNALPEYPRPQMVRDEWLNLNGLWELAVTAKDEGQPAVFDKRILVPFPIEAALSGVMQRIDQTQRVWYRRTFAVPAKWRERQILLHFGAVDWEATVYVNGRELDTHRGGYDAFSLDITDALRPIAEQELVVAVWDPSDAGGQPVGKQRSKPGGIWYTPSSGIWQTVWLEPVPRVRIEGLTLTPDVDRSRLVVTLDADRVSRSHTVDVVVLDQGREVARGRGLARVEVEIPAPRLWSPDDPFLYDVQVTLRWFRDPQRIFDQVKSYFGMRKIEIGKDARGVTRMLLNGEPVFQIGLLDQGFWPDGLYTAPTDEALRYDIEVTRETGFNLARKHVKVEPQRWYYWCDKLGLLVWQDMPNAANRNDADMRQFELELQRLIAGRRNHPCIVMWVPFNEGWGQDDTARIVGEIKQLDPTRLVNNASGWHDRQVGDVHDIHAYPGPSAPAPEPTRAAVLGEFGGLGLRVRGHSWSEEGWGYALLEDREGLARRYEELLQGISQLQQDPGLSAAVYTQTTDVETESNGLLTYDRAVIKIDVERLSKATRGYTPPKVTSRCEIFVDEGTVELACFKEGATIHYTLDGSEPTPSSPKYTGPFALTETATIKARGFWPDGVNSHVSSFVATKVQPIPAVEVGDRRPGLRVDYYEGNWDKLPDMSTLTPVASGVCERFDLRFARRGEYYALRLEGFVTVPATGAYVFYTASDDGSRLFIGDREVVSNDGVHGVREQSGMIGLQAGTHPIRVAFFQGRGGQALEVSYAGPGIDKQPIPPAALLHRKRG